MRCFVFNLLLLSLCGKSYSQQNSLSITLSNPMDYDTINEKEPNFVWQGNIYNNFSDPRYSQRLVLCELETDQLKGEAIILNTPLIVLENYQNTSYAHSSSSTELKEGHTYVWQISVLFNNLIVNQSEPYQFTIHKPKEPSPNFYPVVFNGSNQIYSITNQQIGLVTDEIGELNLTLQVYKNGLPVISAILKDYTSDTEKNETPKSSITGKRFLIFNLKELDLKSGFYRVTWSPKKNKQFTFSFKID